MNKTFIDVTITYYSHHYIKPEVHYYYSDGVTTPVSSYDMDVHTANKLMWELVREAAKIPSAPIYSTTLSATVKLSCGNEKIAHYLVGNFIYYLDVEHLKFIVDFYPII